MNSKVQTEMKITLSKNESFNYKSRRLSYHEQHELSKIIKDLLEKGTIRESESPFASPIVLVRKKNHDEYRLCVDYRTRNSLTLRENYPIPVIEDLIDRFSKKNFYSVMDLKSGFHHIPMHEDSIQYTSFISPLGQFEYTKMPFGLKNASAVFQRFVEKIFRPLLEANKVTIYIDDLLIASETIEEHNEILSEVFTLLATNLLELNIAKCKFYYSEIDYLGYSLSNGGVKPNRTNVEAINQFPIPKNMRELQRFIGMCSYFRKFICDFCHLAKPLQDLIKMNPKIFKFGQEQIDAFENLKSKLMGRPVLSIFTPNNDVELHCDGSSIGYGAILMQKDEKGKMHPIFYYSKRSTEQEAKYHSFELETMAIIYALRRFRIYLLGRKFKVITDCNALKLTLNKQIVNPRISRWALEIQNFDFDIEHREGHRMQHVDALSRSTAILVLEENTFEHTMAVYQDQDPDLEQLRNELKLSESSQYELRNGLIYKKVDKDQIRFYVPKNME